MRNNKLLFYHCNPIAESVEFWPTTQDTLYSDRNWYIFYYIFDSYFINAWLYGKMQVIGFLKKVLLLDIDFTTDYAYATNTLC